MTQPPPEGPPFEAFQAFIEERREHYRVLRSGGRGHEAFMLGPSAASALNGQQGAHKDLVTAAAKKRNGVDDAAAAAVAAAAPPSSAAASASGSVSEETSRHVLLRMTARGYILPLLATGKDDAQCECDHLLLVNRMQSRPRAEDLIPASPASDQARQRLLTAYSENEAQPFNFSLVSALNSMQITMEAFPKLLLHEMQLPPPTSSNGNDKGPDADEGEARQRQSVPAPIWLLSRLLLASALIYLDRPPSTSMRTMALLRQRLLSTAASICRQHCYQAGARQLLESALRELLECASAAAGIRQHREPAPADTVQFAAHGLDRAKENSEDEGNRPTKLEIAFLWLPEDNIHHKLSSLQPKDAPAFARLLLTAIIQISQVAVEQVPTFLLELCSSATDTLLRLFERDASLANHPCTTAESGGETLAEVTHAYLTLFSELRGGGPMLEGKAAGEVISRSLAFIERLCSLPATSEDSLDSESLRLAIAFAQMLRSAHNPLWSAVASSSLAATAATFVKMLAVRVHAADLDKEEEASINLRKSLAWECLMLADPSLVNVASYITLVPDDVEAATAAVRRSTQATHAAPSSTPANTPSWMTTAQAQDFQKRWNAWQQGARFIAHRASLKRKRIQIAARPSPAQQTDVAMPARISARDAVNAAAFAQKANALCLASGASSQPFVCPICDTPPVQVTDDALRSANTVVSQAYELDPLFAQVGKLLSATPVDHSQVSSVLSSLQRIVHHVSDASIASMDSIATCEVLQVAMSSRSRSSRIAATRIVQACARRCHLMSNTAQSHEAASFLKCIISLHSTLLRAGGVASEAAIESLGNVGCIKSDVLRGPTILSLVEQMASGPYLASLSYSQIVHLANVHQCTPFQLLFPHLDTISVLAVTNMVSAPTVFMEILRLTGLTKTKFLQASLQHVLPSLIKLRKKQILSLVAKAISSDERSMCIDQIVPILNACLLEEERGRTAFIQDLSELLGASFFQQLLRSYLPDLLGHLVMNLGNDAKKKPAQQSLQYLHGIVKENRDNRVFSAWLGSESMAIHAWLNEELGGAHGRRSIEQKRMIVRSISELVTLIGADVTSITPQVSEGLFFPCSKKMPHDC